MQGLWSMLYADDAGIVTRSRGGLDKMVTVIVTTGSAFGLTASEAKTGVLRQNALERCRSPSLQPARYTHNRWNLCT